MLTTPKFEKKSKFCLLFNFIWKTLLEKFDKEEFEFEIEDLFQSYVKIKRLYGGRLMKVQGSFLTILC